MAGVNLTIAGVGIDVAQALTIVRSYPKGTVEWYDCAGEKAPPPPKPGVTLGDLGRLTLIEARMSGNDAASFLRTGAKADALWPDRAYSLSTEDGAPGGEAHEAMSALWQHFRKANGLGPAKVSKLLHLKQPGFVPILDSFVRELYLTSALAMSDDNKTPQFWSAIRNDLIASLDAIAELRADLDPRDDHEHRLASLTDLRIFDIVMWSTARAGGIT